MFQLNTNEAYRQPLAPIDADTLSASAADEVERCLKYRENNAATPLRALPGLAAELGVRSVHIKDEGFRLGLGSFKALGGAYAIMRLVLERASEVLGRTVDVSELTSDQVRRVAETMTVACATDGNHGRSVAQGAAMVGSKAAIFVHSGVSDGRIEAIAKFGAQIIRVAGTYDDSVAEASRVAEKNGWLIVSDTSWEGYERIPGLVAQGYTAMVREVLRELPEPPTHVFVQAGVGGVASAVAGHLAIALGDRRPTFVVVDPARAACLFETARTGRPVRIAHGEPTVMAMLECYEPSLVAWRILSRVADAFMTVDEDDAIAAMRRLAHPAPGDPAIVAGESGGAGLAGLVRAIGDEDVKAALDLGPNARVFLINTEGATDPKVYRELVGMTPDDVIDSKAVLLDA